MPVNVKQLHRNFWIEAIKVQASGSKVEDLRVPSPGRGLIESVGSMTCIFVGCEGRMEPKVGRVVLGGVTVKDASVTMEGSLALSRVKEAGEGGTSQRRCRFDELTIFSFLLCDTHILQLHVQVSRCLYCQRGVAVAVSVKSIGVDLADRVARVIGLGRSAVTWGVLPLLEHSIPLSWMREPESLHESQKLLLFALEGLESIARGSRTGKGV